MSTNSSFNIAAFLGISSLPAAVIFTILYAPLTLYNIWRLITKFNFVYVLLALFCQVRTVAFAIRAVLAGSDSAASNKTLVIVDQVLFGAGFTGLLFAVFSLQNDRERMAGVRHKSPIMALLTSGRFIHLFIAAAAALTIVGTIKLTGDNQDDRDLGNTLRTVGTWLLFVITVAAAVRAVLLTMSERSNHSTVSYKSSFVDKNSGAILTAITALMIVRMIYSIVITTKNTTQSEASWYPLSSLPEFLCVCLFALPGLVLSRKELEQKDIEMDRYRGVGESSAPIVV